MPLKSKAQARYLYATHPTLAKEFADKTKSIKALPNKAKSKQKKRKHKVNWAKNIT